MNRVERWLVKLAYPEIDLDTVEIYYGTAFYVNTPLWVGHTYHLERFAYEKFKCIDHATYIHYASACFHFDSERNILLYKTDSFRHGRALYDFEISIPEDATA